MAWEDCFLRHDMFNTDEDYKQERLENMDELLTVDDVAGLLHSHKRTIERKAKNGEYPTKVCGKHGRIWLFNKKELLNFIFPS